MWLSGRASMAPNTLPSVGKSTVPLGQDVMRYFGIRDLIAQPHTLQEGRTLGPPLHSLKKLFSGLFSPLPFTYIRPGRSSRGRPRESALHALQPRQYPCRATRHVPPAQRVLFWELSPRQRALLQANRHQQGHMH